MVQLLVMGAGLIGSRHVHAIKAHPVCQLAGVIEPDTSRHESGDVDYYTSLDEIDKKIDGVVIATPTGLHFENAVNVIERGFHMLIEKPVTATPEEADRLASLLAPTSLHCLVGHHRRYHPSIQLLKKWIADNEIGTPITSSLIWAMRKPDSYFEGNWRASDGSPVMINLIHDIDLMRFILGDIIEVTGFGSAHCRQESRIESGAVALRFVSGLCATISFADSAVSPWGFEAGTGENPHIGTTGQDMWWITGRDGSISFPSLTRWGGAQDWSQPAQPVEFTSDVTVPLTAQLDHFAAVIKGEEAPLITVSDAAASLKATWDIEALFSAQI